MTLPWRRASPRSMALVAVASLLIVNGLIRRRSMFEVALAILGSYRSELARRLGEREEIVDEIGRTRVGMAERTQPPVVLGEPQNAAELVLIVRDVAFLCPRRDGQQRN